MIKPSSITSIYKILVCNGTFKLFNSFIFMVFIKMYPSVHIVGFKDPYNHLQTRNTYYAHTT